MRRAYLVLRKDLLANRGLRSSRHAGRTGRIHLSGGRRDHHRRIALALVNAYIGPGARLGLSHPGRAAGFKAPIDQGDLEQARQFQSVAQRRRR